MLCTVYSHTDSSSSFPNAIYIVAYERKQFEIPKINPNILSKEELSCSTSIIKNTPATHLTCGSVSMNKKCFLEKKQDFFSLFHFVFSD